MPFVRIRHVDAFTQTVLEGNPAAVVDGEGLTAETMQRIALNQKLSETVFLLPPASSQNHARIRIFTPASELPFAGHPTLAAAHTIVEERRVTLRAGEPLRLETGAGVIPVDVGGHPPLYTMTQASPQFRPPSLTREQAAQALGLGEQDVVATADVSTGLWWPLARIASLDAMHRVRPDMAALGVITPGLSLFCLDADALDAVIHVRTFAPAEGVPEDPVTGSSNGCIAALIARERLLPVHESEVRYIAEQGAEMGQPGRVHLRVSGVADDPARDALVVRVGGHAVTALVGELLLP